MSYREEKKTALIVVRTYPTPAKKGAEVSCTAAITDEGEWIRLFPVPWRLLPSDQQFRKYQWVEVSVTKASDSRPESYKLKQDGIKILSNLPPGKDWTARKAIVYPTRAHCLCCLIGKRDKSGFPTLGVFRPGKIERLVVTPDAPNWTQSQLDILHQGHLFLEPPKRDLEKIPFKFQYKFKCEHDECTGHTIMCTDWEMAESWRQWSRKYGNTWETHFRNRYEEEMINKYDTHFFVGTMHQHPGTWIIVGLFYPPKHQKGPLLFEVT
jgi:hypothetical protein